MRKHFVLFAILSLTACSGGGMSPFAPGATAITPNVDPTSAPTSSPSPQPTNSPTPGPLPTSVPTPGPISISRSVVYLNQTAAGAPAPATFTATISDPGYSGAFTASGCSGVATYAILNSTILGSSVNGGTCYATVSDSFGNSAQLEIINTTTVVVPNEKGRKP